jgi:sec-independent protein translocase protein TatA
MINFLAMLNGWEIVLALAVVLILFGAKKLPELAKGLGQGIREFKKASRDVSEEIHSAINVDDTHTPPTPPKRLPPEATQANNVSEEKTRTSV